MYILPVTTVSPAIGNTTIDSSAQNTLTADIASALTTCITKDGQTAVTANLPMSTFRHTGVGNASALQTYASADDVIDNTLLYAGASAAGTDTYAASLPISPGAYKTGQMYSFLADVANTGACTINFNLIGALNIKLLNGNDPETGDIQIGPVFGFYDGTNFVLLNSAFAGLSASQFLRADANTVATGNLTITNAAPQLILNETDGGLDQKKWKLLANTEALQGTAVDAADANAATWLIVQRSGTGSSVSIDSISLGGTIINLAGTFQYNGVSVTSSAADLNLLEDASSNTTTITGAAANSIALNSLVFDANKEIVVDFNAIYGTTGGVLNIELNGDATGTNYFYKNTFNGSASAAVNDNVFLTYAAGDSISARLVLSPNSTSGETLITCIATLWDSGSTEIDTYTIHMRYTGSAAITAIGFLDSAASASIGIGSRLTAKLV